METPTFTEEELLVISAVMPKADPMKIIAPILSITEKIAAYFEGLQREQMAVQEVAQKIASEAVPERVADVPVIDTSPSRNRTKAGAAEKEPA